jgi:hypothetical protein
MQDITRKAVRPSDSEEHVKLRSIQADEYSKVFDLLYAEYRFHDAHFVEANTLNELVAKLEGVDASGAQAT